HRLLYSQLIAACWLVAAAWAACGGLAAARVALATNKVAGIATSRMSFMTALRCEPVTGWVYPSTSMCRAPKAERNTRPAREEPQESLLNGAQLQQVQAGRNFRGCRSTSGSRCPDPVTIEHTFDHTFDCIIGYPP